MSGLPDKCSACDKYVKGKGDERGFCVEEKVTLKGGKFWAAKPAAAGSFGCDKYVAKKAGK